MNIKIEEKLKDLFIAVYEFSQKSRKLYMEILFDGNDKELEINVRTKYTHNYIETRNIYLKNVKETVLDNLIKFVEEYQIEPKKLEEDNKNL